MSGRVVSDIQTRLDDEFVYPARVCISDTTRTWMLQLLVRRLDENIRILYN